MVGGRMRWAGAIGLAAWLVASPHPAQGIDFAHPELLNTTATIDSEADAGAHAAGDGTGHWVVAWHSGDPLRQFQACPGTEVLCQADLECAGQAPVGICRDVQGRCQGTTASCQVDSDCDLCLPGPPRQLCLGTEIECDDDVECEDTLPFGFCGADDRCGDTEVECQATSQCEICQPAAPLRFCFGTGDPIETGKPCTENADCTGDAPPESCQLGGRCGDTELPCLVDPDCEVCTTTDFGTDFDVVVASSDDLQSWTDPLVVNRPSFIDADNDLWPRLATDGLGVWVLVWQSDRGAGEVLVSRSIDGGAQWSPPARLHEAVGVAPGRGHLLPEVSSGGGGVWVAAWESTDPASLAADLVVARSTDAGVSWTQVAQLDAGNDRVPRLANDGSGSWVVVWQARSSSQTGPDADIWISRSMDGGLDWSVPAPLHTNAAQDVRDDLRPQVATDRAGRWVAVWETQDLMGGLQPRLCPGNLAPCQADADCVGTVPARTCVGGECGATRFPCQKDADCARCIEPDLGLDSDIVSAVSTDAGATWSPPAPVNETAIVDFFQDFSPLVATDGLGSWLIAWTSDNPLEEFLDDPIETDRDILMATSSDGLHWCAMAPLMPNAFRDQGADLRPHVTTDGSGTWLAVWDSTTPRMQGQRFGRDNDILFSVASDARVSDADGDDVQDECDNCPAASNPEQVDADSDGFGDACECGDTDGDGRVNTTDARLIQLCSIGMDACGALCDVTGDGVCNTTDARLVQRLAAGQLTKDDLVCAERPAGP